MGPDPIYHCPVCCCRILLCFLRQSIYQSDSLIQIEEEKQGLDVAAMLGGDLGTSGSSAKAEIEIIQSRMVLGEAVKRTAADIVITENRMPLIGSFLTNLGFQSGPFGMGYGYSWASDSVTVTRFDVPEYAVNLPHLLEFSDANTFTVSLDGSVILKGRVGESVSDNEGLYRLFIQKRRGARQAHSLLHGRIGFQRSRVSKNGSVCLNGVKTRAYYQ